LHSIFSHIPGLKVVAPSNAYDAKGIFISAVNDPDPVIFIDDRWLYGKENNVPEEMYEVPIGKAFVKKQGKDITLISSSYTAFLCEMAATELADKGIDVEFVDLCTLKPYDKETILSSVKKTGRAVIVDGSWKTFGYASEISAMISENIFKKLKAPIERVCLPDAPAPASRSLEENYYISKEKIIEAIHKVINYSE
jgi:pyruvate dehydrogenase E1 component beta subunit